MAAVNNLAGRHPDHRRGTSVAPAVTTAEAQAAADLAERIVAGGLALSRRGAHHHHQSDVLRGWVCLNEVPRGDWQTVDRRAPIEQFVTYAFQTDIPPTNATFGFDGGNVAVVPSAQGRAMEVETTTPTCAALQARAGGGPTAAARWRWPRPPSSPPPRRRQSHRA